jgi:leucyl aminopeptidase
LASEQKVYPPIAALPGEQFEINMTGTGDADLYVKLGSQVTTDNWDCRPFDGDSNEACFLTIPPEGADVYVMVRGYANASFSLSSSWLCEE